MAERHYHIIFNPNAGTALATGVTTASLSDLFTRAGLSFDIDDDDDEPLSDRIKRALEGPADVVVGAGGDGTVLAVAEGLLGSDKTLAVLPLGTLNGLARDLGLALDLTTAIAQLPTLEARAIDVAEVNGRSFLHNVIIGLIPSIAVGRELIRGGGIGQKLNFVSFMLRRFARAKRIALALRLDDAVTRIERVQTLVVANNSYDQRFGAVMARRRLDRGTLTAYLIRSLKVGDAVRLAFEMALGRWRDDPVIEYEKVKTLTVTSKKQRLLVTMDGEVLTMETPLVFGVQPRSLQVLAPPLAVPTEAPQPAPTPETV
jgi:diacylglycerol kinase family enzyme